jgi:hypothetical protein
MNAEYATGFFTIRRVTMPFFLENGDLLWGTMEKKIRKHTQRKKALIMTLTIHRNFVLKSKHCENRIVKYISNFDNVSGISLRSNGRKETKVWT